MRSLAIVLTLSLATLSVDAFGLTQSVHVRGRLLCGSAPAANVQVKLEDYDHGSV